MLFSINGASEKSVAAWEPPEAASLFSDASSATYNRHETESFKFQILPVEEEDPSPEDAAVVLEWKAGGWFKGLTVYYKVEML